MKNTTYFSSVTCSGSEDAYFDENHNRRKSSAFNFGGFISEQIIGQHSTARTHRRQEAPSKWSKFHSHQSQHWHFVNGETTDKTTLQQDAVFLQAHFNTLQ